MDPGTTGAAADDQTYEQARAELTEVVRALETGGVTLAASLELWERGEELARRCGEFLDGAQARLDGAQARSDGAQARSDGAPARPDGTQPGPRPDDRSED